jgi:signal transduction histidine kinase
MGKDMREDFILQSYNHTQRLSKLLTDISIINRMDEALDIIDREDISLNKLIHEVIEERVYSSQTQQIPIKIENMDNVSLEMKGNAMLLRAVFRNLIDNAMNYSGGTEIVIRYLSEEKREKGIFYQFLFYDNGICVSSEHRSHLYERFYRVDKGRSRKLGGTGLGLSIVKNAVLLHGGNIEVRNRPTGGLEFFFALKIE